VQLIAALAGAETNTPVATRAKDVKIAIVFFMFLTTPTQSFRAAYSLYPAQLD
jgi:hypothetical protein